MTRARAGSPRKGCSYFPASGEWSQNGPFLDTEFDESEPELALFFVREAGSF